MDSTKCTGTDQSILELDAGNTRLKWRLLRQGQVADAGHLANSDAWRVQLPVLLEQLGPVDLARASVVSGQRRRALLTSVIAEDFGIRMHFAATRKHWQGLTVAYREAEKLGVDRWLAMLAAQHAGGERVKLVVDCGTALTLDVVDAFGCHLGGYIVPGLGMMKKTLQANTAGLAVFENPVLTLDPGRTTRDCINQGIVAMVTALISHCAERYPGALVFLTGGDADQVAPAIVGEYRLVADLVMDGLALAFAPAAGL